MIEKKSNKMEFYIIFTILLNLGDFFIVFYKMWNTVQLLAILFIMVIAREFPAVAGLRCTSGCISFL